METQTFDPLLIILSDCTSSIESVKKNCVPSPLFIRQDLTLFATKFASGDIIIKQALTMVKNWWFRTVFSYTLYLILNNLIVNFLFGILQQSINVLLLRIMALWIIGLTKFLSSDERKVTKSPESSFCLLFFLLLLYNNILNVYVRLK